MLDHNSMAKQEHSVDKVHMALLMWPWRWYSQILPASQPDLLCRGPISSLLA